MPEGIGGGVEAWRPEVHCSQPSFMAPGAGIITVTSSPDVPFDMTHPAQWFSPGDVRFPHPAVTPEMALSTAWPASTLPRHVSPVSAMPLPPP
jgi:hypothetical protein